MIHRGAGPALLSCLFLLPATGCGSAPPGRTPGKAVSPAAPPSRTFQDRLLEEVLRKACPKGTRIRTWAGAAMTDPIDGAAQEYLRLGALGLARARLPKGEELLLFDMGTSAGAYGAFLAGKDPGPPLGPGLARSGGALLGRKGRFLLECPPSWRPRDALALLSLLPGGTGRPPCFEALPRAGLRPGTERILSGDPWGFGLFRWGLSGRYGEPPCTFLVLLPRERDPHRTLEILKTRLAALGAPLEKEEGRELQGSAPGLGRFLFLAGKGRIFAFTEIPPSVSRRDLEALAAEAREAPPPPALPPWESPSRSEAPGESRRPAPRKASLPTLAEVEEAIGKILERFIEDPKEPFSTSDLSGAWRLQVGASFEKVTCRPARAEGKGWDFFLEKRLTGKVWIHLEKTRTPLRFRGWIRAMGPKGTFLEDQWPFAMTLAPDGSELNGKIRPPGTKREVHLHLVRPVHVKDHEKLRARLRELLALRERLRRRS